MFVFFSLQCIVCVVFRNINVTCLSHSLPAMSVVFRMTAARVDAWKRFEVEWKTFQRQEPVGCLLRLANSANNRRSSPVGNSPIGPSSQTPLGCWCCLTYYQSLWRGIRSFQKNTIVGVWPESISDLSKVKDDISNFSKTKGTDFYVSLLITGW